MSGLRSSRNLSAPPTLIRAGNLECNPHFWTLGVKPDPMVPHTWGLGHPQQFPRGGSCSNIYKDMIRIIANITFMNANISFMSSILFHLQCCCESFWGETDTNPKICFVIMVRDQHLPRMQAPLMLIENNRHKTILVNFMP